MIKVCIIDDEESNRIILAHFLSQYHNEIEIIGQADRVRFGVKMINELKPDLIFLDIEMPDGTGFDLLNQIQEYIPEIIFYTAYNQFAIRAIDCSALAYLLKPITKEALENAIQKAKTIVKNKQQLEQYQILKDNVNNPNLSALKFAVSNSDGTHIICFDKIICCTAHSNYTDIHLEDNKKITVSKTLKEIEVLLENQHQFLRVHQSNIVNINKIDRIIKADNNLSIIVRNGLELAVSRSKKEELLEKLQVK